MKKMMRLLVTMIIVAAFLTGCGSNNASQYNSNSEITQLEKVKTDNVQNPSTETTDKTEIDEKLAILTNEVESMEEPQKHVDTSEIAVAKEQSESVVQQKEAANKSNSEAATQSNKKADQSQEKEKPKQATNTPGNTSTANPKIEQETKPNTPVNEATISIKADAETGVILKVTKVSIEEGDTVLELLKKVTKQNRIQIEYRGSGATAYIEGIQNLYEFDKGPKSGWMYSVNGIFMKKGAGTTEVKPGDKIEWAYTLDLGKDLGATVNE